MKWKKFQRVKKAYGQAILVGGILSIAAFLVFQLFPRQIIALFGEGSEAYYKFAISYFRVFLFFTFLNVLQPISSNFFTAIGKPINVVFLSLTRQTLFLLPLILILPIFMGIDGVLYAGPIADFTAGIVSAVMVWKEFGHSEFK